MKERQGSTTERRRSYRYKGRKEAILINPNGMHNIKDISENGLKFRCSETDFYPRQWPVEIVYAGTTLYLRGMTVRFIREELKDGDTLISSPTKEVGVEFLDMDDQVRNLLTELINLHAEAEFPGGNLPTEQPLYT